MKTFIKTLIITMLITFLAIWSYSELNNYLLEKSYNECYKKNKGSLIIPCDTDEYFVYRAEDVIEPKRDCIYIIKDSKAGEFRVNCEHIKKIVEKFGKDKTLIAIIFQESGFNPLARNVNTNKSIDSGIFQLNSNYWTMKNGDIDHSISQAVLCKKQNGYNCWVAHSTGAYKNYLDEADVLLSKLN